MSQMDSSLKHNRGCRIRVRRSYVLTAVLALYSLPGWAQQNPPDLTEKSLEDLMNVEVTSVSKKAEKLSRTAAAIYVVTQEDIRRSGALNIPDVLRTVPGLEVAQIDSNTWAISARGLNKQFANELLVLVDGRDVYSPTFGGVYWDVLDLPLEDIERIEVIRGPGGSIWGANAVNGVINIITKTAADTNGALVVEGGGNVDQGFGTVQYGGDIGKSWDYRSFAKYINIGFLPNSLGQDGGDSSHILRGGFRADGKVSARDSLMLEGDLYSGAEGNPSATLPSVTSPSLVPLDLRVNVGGGDILGIWHRTVSSRSETTLQVSYDAYQREDHLREHRHTADVAFQDHLTWGERQDLVWGLEYTDTWYNSHGDLYVSLIPASLNHQTFSSFVQDQIAVVPNRFYLTAGVKLEHNDYTGFGWMPTVRALYAASEHHTLWAAYSRALVTPSSTFTNSRVNFGSFLLPGGLPDLVSLFGNPKFKDKSLNAFEFGYRAQVRDNLSLDFATYYHLYDHEPTVEVAPPFFETTPAPPHLVFPLIDGNLMHGEEHGLEIAATWEVTSRWTLSPAYDFARIHMHTYRTSTDFGSVLLTEGNDPHVQAQLRSHLNVWRDLGWNCSANFVDRLIAQRVPSYTRLDTGFSWNSPKGVSLSVVGQNLLKSRHFEFIGVGDSVASNLIKRSLYAKLTWKF